ncbi:MAG: Uma2 family endonuclease [Gemmataceae bacterium]
MIFKSQEELERELYPDDDGLPMADNTLQYEWIVTIKGNLDALFHHDPNVFVAGNHLWYAVEGEPTIRTAPDAMVVFGRPKGYRGSYKQWREAGIAPQVVFKILSPGNRAEDLTCKFEFYDRYGVEEYYMYDPDEVVLSGWRRVEGQLQRIESMHGWVSPLLGIRFDMSGEELAIFGPNEERFLSFVEVKEQQERERQRADAAEKQAQKAQKQTRKAQKQTRKAQEQTLEAQRKAEQLTARLRALGIDLEA